MKIEVINQDWVEEPISINIDGLCNHADTYFEDGEEDDYNAIHEFVGTTPYTNEICNKCKCWRTVFEYADDYSDWNGVEDLPMISTINNGILVLR